MSSNDQYCSTRFTSAGISFGDAVRMRGCVGLIADPEDLPARELLHHEAGPAAGDVSDDGGAAMDLGDQSQIDRERELHLLSFTQPKILRLHEHTVCAQVLGFADSALAPRQDHVHGGACAVTSMQTTLHPYDPGFFCGGERPLCTPQGASRSIP